MDTKEGLILEVGKRYQLRNGLVTSPLRLGDTLTNYKFEAEVDEFPGKALSIMAWLPDGSFLTRGHENRHDIIKEI